MRIVLVKNIVHLACSDKGSVRSYEPEDKKTQAHTPDHTAPFTQHPDILLPDLALDMVVFCSRMDTVLPTKTSPTYSFSRYHVYTLIGSYLLHTCFPNISSRTSLEKKERGEYAMTTQ